MVSRSGQCCVLMALFGCGAHRADPSRVIVVEAAPTVSMVRTAQPTALAPWSHRQGMYAGPPISQKPQVAWTLSLPGPVVLPLTTDGAQVYAVSDGNVYAIALDGSKRWTARVDAVGTALPHAGGVAVALATGRVVHLSSDAGVTGRWLIGDVETRSTPLTFQDAVVAISVDGWLITSTDEAIKLTSAPVSDIAADEERIYLGTNDGEAIALDRSGVIWQTQLPGPVIGHPVVGEHSVFFATGPAGDRPGGVTAVRRIDGETTWEVELGLGASTAPALGRFLIVPCRSSELIALDLEHGGARWRFPGYADFSVTPALTQGDVYAGNADGRLHRVDMHDGGEAWSIDLGATITGEPLLIEGLLVVGLADGRVVGLK